MDYCILKTTQTESTVTGVVLDRFQRGTKWPLLWFQHGGMVTEKWSSAICCLEKVTRAKMKRDKHIAEELRKGSLSFSCDKRVFFGMSQTRNAC